MKVETPQLRWHQIANASRKKDEAANAPIFSCSLLTINDKIGVLATAGNDEVNLFRVGFTDDSARSTTGANKNDGACEGASDEGACDADQVQRPHILVQPQTSANPTQLNEHTRIEYLGTLKRGMSERTVNAAKFSPSGEHLILAGDGGTVVMYSLPPGQQHNISLWNNKFDKESELSITMKVLFNQTDDVMDAAWSADSKRFTLCSLDHTLTVWELLKGEKWEIVHRSSKDHTHYVQGVAYDPKGVYLASMGSDRMVKVYSRKNVKDNVVKGELAKYELEKTTSGDAGDSKGKEHKEKHAFLQTKVLPELLTNSNFALQHKTKTIKFLNAPNKASESNDKDATKESSTPNPKRHHMFADELTLGSFFRRLSFTTDGAFLVVPAALWHGRNNDKAEGGPGSPTSVANHDGKLAESSYATYLFARHHFDQPYKVLTGLEKPSVVVRPNPVLFQLPSNSSTNATGLPYRSIFAVLTNDSVLIYDTHHNQPLAIARGLHYASLTDATWSNDGKTLFVTSSDGYISILSFGNGELGDVYEAPAVNIVEKNATTATATANPVESSEKKVTFGVPLDDRSNQPPDLTQQPVVINTLVGKKKKKKVAPTLVEPAPEQNSGKEEGAEASGEKKRAPEETAAVPVAPQEPVVNILLPKKKKKVAGSSTPVATA